MTKVVINGAKGRMGQMLIECAGPIEHVDVIGAVDIGDDLSAVIEKCDVLIDFSLHDATVPAVELCAHHGVDPVAVFVEMVGAHRCKYPVLADPESCGDSGDWF